MTEVTDIAGMIRHIVETMPVEKVKYRLQSHPSKTELTRAAVKISHEIHLRFPGSFIQIRTIGPCLVEVYVDSRLVDRPVTGRVH